MRKYLVLAILGSLFLASCAQKEEKRDEFKKDHNVDEKRNAGVPDAALVDSTSLKDSMNVGH